MSGLRFGLPFFVLAWAVDCHAGFDPVTVEISEGWPEKWTWATPVPAPSSSFSTSGLALIRLPAKYNERGIEADRKAPIVLRASGTLQTKAGPIRILLRSRHAARLVIDGRPLAETKPISRNSSGHEAVPPENHPADPRWQPLRAGGQERLVDWISDGKPHFVELWGVVGGKGLRNETGELLAAVVEPGGVPRLIGSNVELTRAGWSRFVKDESARLTEVDSQTRRRLAARETGYWDRRHRLARQVAKETQPAGNPEKRGNLVDGHLGGNPAASVDDYAFLRRLTLDTTGVIPSPEEIDQYLKDSPSDRRQRAIERRLADERWADSWMGYWQDVLAENPGLLKPTLNNTGPFRTYLRNAMADNLPMDRFVTDLIRMEGSQLGGGAAGFGMATQNDAPMAAKAQVLAKAFLAADLKCARCHDAPFHPYGQEDLFGVAALLANQSLKIPATSTVKRQPGGRTPRVSISIEAGESVSPEWNLTDITPDSLPEGLLPEKASPREHLAALITSPANRRFARVIANRVWARFMGSGLVEPIDDWDGDVKTRHPELLDDLAQELITHDYDLKHLARVILSSQAYQAKASASGSKQDTSPSRRRMTAEQILDSLFAAVGKPFRAEELCLDIDGRRPPSEFLNLGKPTRAWQLALPSNERDRPALTLPVVSSLTDVLQAFGWRAARPDALTVREEATTPLQPAALANDVVIDSRIARLSDDSAITELALKDQSAEALVQAVMLRILSRPATEAETKRLVAFLGDTYANRVVPGAKIRPSMRESSRRVSWSNHLHPDATMIQQEEERVVREGDPPTERLRADFRERMEEIVWALVNSPEFVFIP